MPLKVGFPLILLNLLYKLTLFFFFLEFEMLHDDEVIPKYAAGVVIGRVKGQTPSLEY